MLSVGYHHCACRDCFELYVGKPGEMCLACEEAGCELDSECEAPHTYCSGVDTDEIDPHDPHPDTCRACGQPY